MTIALKMTPVFIGSAYKNKGVQLLLDGVNLYLPEPDGGQNIALDQNKKEEKVILESDPKKPFVGLAFKLEDGRYGQLTYMRVYQGSLTKGDFIVNNSTNRKRVKVPRLVRMHSNEMNDIETATAGDIVALFGVECASGDTFTDESINYTMTSMHVPEAVISLAVAPKDKANAANFSKALNRFTKEDPTFRVHRDEESAQTIISGMGELHLEIYIERMKREYASEVISGKPQVAYREAIGQHARVQLHPQEADRRLGPVRQGGAATSSPCPPSTPPASSSSTTSSAARSRASSSRPARRASARRSRRDRSSASRSSASSASSTTAPRTRSTRRKSRSARRRCMAFREAYATAKPTILEPIMRVEVQFPEEFQGAVLGQLNQRRGTIISSEKQEGFVQAMAEVPLNDMFGYSTDLRSATQGKGEFTMEFQKYAEVPKQQREVMMAEFRSKKEKEAAAR